MTALVCPYCRTNIDAGDAPQICEGCGVAHHADCYAENGGCTIFGCSRAPGDEPKVSVSTPELAAETPAVPVEPRLPPPPPPGLIPPPVTTSDLQPVANRVVPSMFGGFASGDTSGPDESQVHEPRKRTSYIMLGALLGAFGAHNFYAGYHKKAGIQLAITLLTLGLGSPMSWLWAVIDICTIDRDVRGVQFES